MTVARRLAHLGVVVGSVAVLNVARGVSVTDSHSSVTKLLPTTKRASESLGAEVETNLAGLAGRGRGMRLGSLAANMVCARCDERLQVDRDDCSGCFRTNRVPRILHERTTLDSSARVSRKCEQQVCQRSLCWAISIHPRFCTYRIVRIIQS